MPEPLWISRMALRYFPNIATCSAMAGAFASVSHAQVTRLLQGPWSGHILLNLALRALCTGAGGVRIVADTVVDKPSARLLGAAAWVWARKQRQVVCGGSVVWLVWTDGPVRIPLAFRRWHNGGPSQCALALARLRYARHRLRWKPQCVLFDSWYPSKQWRKRIRDSGWSCVCQRKKNRSFAGRAVHADLQQPYWPAVGTLSGGQKALW
jgi:hypothetical protein